MKTQIKGSSLCLYINNLKSIAMETTKISIDFSTNKYSDKELSVKTKFIIGQMTDNSNFQSPTPQLAVLQDALDRFSTAITKMEDGNKQDTIDKNARRAELENLLRQEASYVQQTSGGSEEIIATSGFDSIKKKSPVAPLPMVTGISIKAGASRGSLELNWDVLEHAHAYEVKYTEAPGSVNSIWSNVTVTRRKVQIENLVRGKQYAFCVAGIGSDPSRIWSDEVTSYVM
jgi:hypothetical protein